MTAKELRKAAWDSLSQQQMWWPLIGACVVYAAILGALSFTYVGTIILMGPLGLGLVAYTIAIYRRQKPSFGKMFSGFDQFGNAFLLYLLNNIFISLWSLLFLIPGIVKVFSYAMSPYILADHPGMSQDEARRRSMEMMKGNKWRLFCLYFSFIGWWLLCALTFGLLTLWVVPYVNMATAAFYEDLVAPKKVVENGANTAENTTSETSSDSARPYNPDFVGEADVSDPVQDQIARLMAPIEGDQTDEGIIVNKKNDKDK
ncbi:MAG: DUF975 family protein [Christensenellaceae bacterium]